MKERPILFSGPMVRAILDGRKTQTRRVVKPQPSEVDGQLRTEGAAMIAAIFGRLPTKEDEDAMKPVCPFGVPGDRLWVRETLRWSYNEGQCTHGIQHPPEPADLLYDANDEYVEVGTEEQWAALPARWERIPSIHMPRWASRITLEVVSVRVERLQEISEKDAVAEGFDAKTCETIFLQAAGRSKPVDPYYVRFEDGTDSEGKLCEQCATRHLVKAKKPGRIACEHGNESDGPFYCEECYRPLLFSPTAYGVERELFLECDDGSNIKDFAATGMDAAIAAMIAGGIGDLREEHLGRLAKIGLATWFDLAYGNGAWKSNPWVWVVEFKRAEVKQ